MGAQKFDFQNPTASCYSRSFSVRYESLKRIAVTPVIYAPDGTIAKVLINGYHDLTLVITTNVVVSGNWTFPNNGETGFSFQAVNRSVALATGAGGAGANANFDEGIAIFHFVADARLGIV